MGHAHDVIDELRGPTRSLHQAAPEAWEGFTKLHGAAVADGVLPARGEGAHGTGHCGGQGGDGCIAYHAKAAARQGATPEEVAEALSVALLMDGGTASVYGPLAWAAFEEFCNPNGNCSERLGILRAGLTCGPTRRDLDLLGPW